MTIYNEILEKISRDGDYWIGDERQKQSAFVVVERQNKKPITFRIAGSKTHRGWEIITDSFRRNSWGVEQPTTRYNYYDTKDAFLKAIKRISKRKGAKLHY